MKRILYILLFMVAAGFGLTACSESYPSVDYHNESTIVNLETPGEGRPVPLLVYVDRQSFFSLSSTRGAGHFDPIDNTSTDAEKDKYYKTPFYLFAFRDPKSTSTTYSNALLHSQPDLTYSLMATNGGKKDTEKLNCLVDGSNFYEGYKAFLDDKGGLELPNNPPFYYPNYQDVGFNFFAYSIDDAKAKGSTTAAQAQRTSTSIYYDIEIDGTQDIICGYAPGITEADFAVGTGRYNRVELAETEKRRILDIGNFCTYAAHRNIHPYLAMRHQLTRLEFIAYPGDSTADFVTIDRIEVQAPMTGRLVVADNDTTKIGYTPDMTSVGWFKLHEAPKPDADGNWKCDEMPEGKYHTNPWHKEYDPDPEKHPELKVPITERIQPDEEKVFLGGEGACIMLPESEEFLVKIVATYDPDPDDPTKKRQFESVYALKPQQSDANKGEDGVYRFCSGHYYSIAVAVYGLQEIKVFTTIDGWKEGETMPIDFDNPVGGGIY